MITQRVVRSGVNPNVIHEGFRPGEFLVSEVSNYGCRENVTVSGGTVGVAHNSVLADADGAFVGIVFEGVKAGETAFRGVIARGPCEVSLARMVFPNAIGPAEIDEDGNEVPGEGDDAALRDLLIEAMQAKGIVVRD